MEQLRTDLELLVSRYLSGDLTEEEKTDLMAYLAHHEEAQRVFDEYLAAYAISSTVRFAKHEEENLSAIKKRLSDLPKSDATARKTVLLWAKIAAFVAIVLSCHYTWNLFTKNESGMFARVPSPYEIAVPAGSRTNVTLPDGTEITLNAGSVLKYSGDFGVSKRIVTLDGEGFFRVAKDTARPFLVHNNNVQVEVVGTTFNICGYNDDDYTRVSLLEGCVDMRSDNGEEIRMYPNEQVLYDKCTGRMLKTKSDASNAGGWIGGGLTFEDSPFADIAHRLERKFQVKINIGSERLKQEHYSGSFDNDQSLNEILTEINVEKQYTWKTNGNTIFITDKEGGTPAK